MVEYTYEGFERNAWFISKGEAADGKLSAAVQLHELEPPPESLPAVADWTRCSGKRAGPQPAPSAVCRQLRQQLREG